MKIASNKVVSVTYELHSSKGSDEKKFVETANIDNPLTFLCGTGSMIPKFEEQIAGLSLGDKFAFSILPEEAYGTVDADAIVSVPLDVFKVEGVVDYEILKVGNVLPMRDNEGNSLNGKVVIIENDHVILDFNHPLAGQQLHFKGEVIEVREATTDELEHGHAHTPGMHD
ncbi:MAG: peptidylprolyl isomerase [Bacteroidia bacterium]